MISHTEAVRLALMTVSILGHRAWSRHVGTFQDQRGHWHKLGTKGEADLQGILRGGWALAVEIKTGNGTRTPQQLAWGRMWARMGGCYVVARYSDCEDGDTAIRAAIEHYLANRGTLPRDAAA